MARQTTGLRAPQPGDGALVATTTRPGTLYRTCASHHATPWWYSSRDLAADPGRFDLNDPDGTCYWAVTAGGAILEAVADPDQDDSPLVTTAALADLTVWEADELAAAATGPIADTTVASHPRLNGEVATIVPYDLPWQWADEFDGAARTGIVYTGRFSQDDCLALFGPSGPTADPAAQLTRHPAITLAGEIPSAHLGIVGTVGTASSLSRAPAP